jgi:hypothetical protein
MTRGDARSTRCLRAPAIAGAQLAAPAILTVGDHAVAVMGRTPSGGGTYLAVSAVCRANRDALPIPFLAPTCRHAMGRAIVVISRQTIRFVREEQGFEIGQAAAGFLAMDGLAPGCQIFVAQGEQVAGHQHEGNEQPQHP